MTIDYFHRSDFVTLPFQASEVLLDNIAPLPGKTYKPAYDLSVFYFTKLKCCLFAVIGEVAFSPEAKTALEELTANVALILKVVL